ncbi:MAG: hypothetical protein WAU00_23105 [Caldilinea sp.]
MIHYRRLLALSLATLGTMALLAAVMLSSVQADSAERTALQSLPLITATVARTPGPTNMPCPFATPDPLWVEPVLSPTELLTQTIVANIRNGEAVTVTVTTASGVFTRAGSFGSAGAPARVEIHLLPGVTHHLTVAARVGSISVGDCTYGGYTVSTQHDRYGIPLNIVQRVALTPSVYLPVVQRGAEAPGPTWTPTVTSTQENRFAH